MSSTLASLLIPPETQRVILVTYDLKTVGKDYKSFYEALKQHGHWWHHLDTTWLIHTTKTPKDVYNAVITNITTSDRLMIIEVKRPYWGYLPKEAWDWVDQRLP